MQYNQTPLHLAAWGGHVDVAETLIQNGAEIDVVSLVSNLFSHEVCSHYRNYIHIGKLYSVKCGIIP